MEEKNNYEKVDVNDVESILEAANEEKLPRSETIEASGVKQGEDASKEKNTGSKTVEVSEVKQETFSEVSLPQTEADLSHVIKKEKPKEETPHVEVNSPNHRNFMPKEFRKGDLIKVTVVKMEPNGVLVSAGTKEDVFIPLHGLSLKPANTPEEVVKVGDKIDVLVLRDGTLGGSLSLSKKMADYHKKWDTLKSKFERAELVQGNIVKEIKGGLLVDIDSISAFLPQSQIGLRKGEVPKDFVGKALDLHILELDKSLKRIIVSRLKVLEEIKEQERKKALVSIKKGEIYEGVVRSIQEFGVFVDLGKGIEGLIRINELTWGRRRPPQELLKVGETVKVKVIGVNLDTEKVSLSLRQTRPYPWDVVDTKYPVESVVEGPVIRIHEFGAVIELEDGLTGLVHISQLDSKRVNKVEDVVKVGDLVKAKVIAVDKENKKIKLSRKALEQAE